MQAIYALIDPRDMKEFYIGRTEDIYRRFREHLACVGRNDAKNQRIKELQSLHLVPIMKTLELVEDAALAGQREAYWIRHFRYLGHSLSNDTTFDFTDDEQVVKPQKQLVQGNAAKRIQRLLNKYPNMTLAEIARRVGVTRQYAHKVKAQIIAEKTA